MGYALAIGDKPNHLNTGKEKQMKVRVTKAGDGMYQVGEVIPLEAFIASVRAVLENGGEMPIAILEP